MRRLLVLTFLTILPVSLFAASLTLRDGTVIYGQFISGNTQQIVFQDDNGGRRNIALDRVLNIDFTPANPSSAQYNPPAYQNPPQYQNPQTAPAYQNPPAYSDNANRVDDRGDHPWAILPAGTEIQVRNDQTINSQNAAEGRTFPATIVQDVLDDRGRIVIPRGTPAQLVIRQVNEGGTTNNGNFMLDLDTVSVNGRQYRVSTTDLEARDQNGIGKNKRTGEYVGGGAVLGTLLGAIAGGGKGAAIGAIAGAAAGGGAQVLTKGHEIRVPVETVLRFRLDQPLHLHQVG